MKLIIDVPEEVYEALKGITEDSTSLDPYSLADIIVNKSEVIEELKPQGDLISISEAKKLGATCLARRNENGQLEAIISLDNAPTVHDTINLYPSGKVIIQQTKPQGEWIKHSTYKDVLICSNCNHGSNQVYDTFNFCPNCGAKMKNNTKQ